MGATLFAISVSILILGWLWFYIVRPILEDYGVIVAPESVKDYADAAPVVAPIRPSSDTSSQRVEPAKIADTPQPEPDAPAMYEPPSDPLIISHKMSKKELTILLAVQKDDEGGYRFSANKIAEFVGGTSAEVKGWVAEVRGKREPASNSLRRPTGGWKVKAS